LQYDQFNHFSGHILQNGVLFSLQEIRVGEAGCNSVERPQVTVSKNAENDGRLGGFEQIPTRTVRVIWLAPECTAVAFFPVRSAPFIAAMNQVRLR